MEIKITKTTNPKAKPDQSNLGFGKHFTDHMFIMEYTDGIGWHDAKIMPYGPIEMDPASMVFHYGQAIFEGLKAYLTDEGKIQLFRPEQNMMRINKSNERMCMPQIDVDFCVDAICRLVKIDRDFIPTAKGTSLYIRPFMIATDAMLGVHPSHTYKFIVILSPVGAYYATGLNPIKIYVESNYVRAVRGGTGFAKTAGNYAASLKAQDIADEKGYAQVLWLDGVERKYIEEVGAMNVFFKVKGEVITPALLGSILPGITRASTIELLQSWGVPVSERRISIDEIVEYAKNGDLEEVFGTGTAAVISPVGELCYKDEVFSINNGEIGDLSMKIYEAITGIQSGKIKDEFNWVYKINE